MYNTINALTTAFLSPLTFEALKPMSVDFNYSKIEEWFTFKQKDGSFESKLKLPGFQKNEIKISFENKITSDILGKRLNIVAKSTEYGSYSFYTFIPSTMDDTSVNAVLKNGILHLTAKTDIKKTKERLIEITEE
jgi:HSP20 family molecular chaperone IbpA